MNDFPRWNTVPIPLLPEEEVTLVCMRRTEAGYQMDVTTQRRPVAKKPVGQNTGTLKRAVAAGEITQITPPPPSPPAPQ